MRRKAAYLSVLLVLFIAACGSEQQTLSVSEVIENANSLDGKPIRVRGQVFLWIEPSPTAMWMFGGCAPAEPSRGNVIGWLTLYEHIDPEDLQYNGAPHNNVGIKIAQDSFDCGGNYCQLTCKGFEAVSGRMYEFFGTLRINADSELLLENIDLSLSRQLVDEEWVSITAGEFNRLFP